MWVYDGETWSREGGSDDATRPSVAIIPGHGEMVPVPELQIMEIVPTPRTREIELPFVVPDVVRKPR